MSNEKTDMTMKEVWDYFSNLNVNKYTDKKGPKKLTFLSLELINFNIILFADFGPKPGSFEIIFVNFSISSKFCI